MAMVSLVVTYLVGGSIGWGVARKVNGMPSRTGWILLVLATVLAQWILPGTRVIDLFQFKIYANHLLQGVLAGTIVALQLRKSSRHPAAA